MTVWANGDTTTAIPDLTSPTLDAAIGALDGFTGSISLLGGGSLSYWEIYRRQLWVNVCVNKISRGISRLPFKAYQLGADGDREHVGAKASPLAQLVRRPYAGGTTFRYWNQVLVTLYVYGKSLSAMLPDQVGGEPTSIVPMDWRHLRIYMKDGAVRFYRWKHKGVEHTLLPSEVCTHEYYGGFSPLDPLRSTLRLEDAAQRASAASFENGIMPSGIVTVDKTMQDESFDALEEQLRAKHGGPDRRFRLAVTDAAVKWQQLSFSSAEAEMIEHRKLNREECAAAFDIDPTQIGILDRATFSNVSDAHKRLYMDTFGPPIAMLEQDFSAQVIEPWADVWGDVFCEFELDAILRGDPKERSEAHQRWINSGVYAPNEIRRMENLKKIVDPRADAIYLPLNLEPVGPGLAAADRTAAKDAAAKKAAEGAAAHAMLPGVSETGHTNPEGGDE